MTKGRWRLAAVSALAWLAFLAPTAARAEPADTLRYRRVFVPQTDLDQQVRGLLPLKRDEFERRVQEASSSARGEWQLAPVHLREATYRARLRDEDLVEGRADLVVALRRAAPAMLPLEPLSLALVEAKWQGPPERAAVTGQGPDGRLFAEVEQTGVLQLEWTLSGRRDERGDLVFDWQSPPAPINRLHLELPQDMTLLLEGTGLLHAPVPAADPAFNTWTVESGAAHQLTLRAARSSTPSPREPLVVVEERVIYAVGQSSIDLDLSLELHVLQQALDHLTLELGEGLQLTVVRLGERLLDWRALPATGGQNRVRVTLPEPLRGEGHLLRLSGVIAWPDQARLQLPRVALAGGTWQEGRATITAPATLRVSPTPLAESRQSSFSASSAVRATDEWQFQYHSLAAALEIAAPTTPPPLVEVSGMQVQLTATQVQATLIAELSTVAGQRFSIDAQIPRAWIVDAVEVQPADMLEDRRLQTRGPQQQLQLALRRPLQEGGTLSVTIRAHRRPLASDQPLPDDLFELARFSDVRSAERLVSLHNSSPGAQWSLSGDEPFLVLDPAKLDASEQRLFESPPGPLLFRLDRQSLNPQVRLTATGPRYQAELSVRADVGQDQIRQTFQIRCMPQGTSVGHVRVRLTPPPGVPVEWRLAGEDPRELSVRQGEAAAKQGTDEGIYELILRRPRAEPFEIRGELVRAVSSDRRLSLVALPLAFSQSGRVQIFAQDGLPLTINAGGMEPLLPAESNAKDQLALRGSYHYQPGRETSLEATPSLGSRGPPLGWIESRSISSRLSADGSATHEAIFRLRTAGRTNFRFRLPAQAQQVRAQVEGEEDARSSIISGSDGYLVRLPSTGRAFSVRVTYASQFPALGWWPWGQVTAPVPQTDLPLLTSDWRVQLSPGLEAADSLWRRDSQQAQRLADLASDPAMSAWTTYRVRGATEPLATVAVYRPRMIEAWAWSAALLAAAIALRLDPGSIPGIAAGVCLFAAGAMFLPRELAPVALGAIGGLGAGAMGVLLKPRPRLFPTTIRSTASEARRAIVAAGQAGAVVLVSVGLFGVFVKGAWSQTGAEPGNWGRVVIPIDDERQPVGDYVFVEPALYDALVRLSGEKSASAVPWLLRSCQYRPVAIPLGEAGTLGLHEIVADHEIQTFQQDARVLLPWKRTEIHLIEGRARLDGKPVALDWSPDGAALQLIVPMPGRHRFEMAFIAPAKAEGNRLRIDVDVPRAAQSQVILPAALGTVRVLSASGATRMIATTGERVTDLGPTQRLAIEWPADGSSSGDTARLEGQQLVLWNVRPGSVVAEGQFRVQPLGGTIREVLVEFDSRLRLLPLTASSAVARHWIDDAAPTSTLHLVLKQPAADEIVLRVSWLWPGSTGVGNLELPTVRLAADRATRSWTGVALGAGLEWKTQTPVRPDDPSPQAFADAWQQSTGLPEAAFDVAQNSVPTIAIQPAQSHVEIRETVECSIGVASIAVHYRGILSRVPLHAFGHRLEMPPGLHVSRLTVFEGKRPLRIRWDQAPDGNVSIALSQPPAAQIRLELEGYHSRLPGEASAELPLVRYGGSADPREVTLRAFRQPEVQLAFSANPADWTAQEPPDLRRHQQHRGRLAAAWHRSAAAPTAAPRVAVSPNQPQVAGALVLRLAPHESGWEARVDCLLEVRSGLLDVLRFEVPADWTGPFEITPAAEYSLQQVPGQAAQRLRIYPQQAIVGDTEFSIRIPHGGAEGNAAKVPNVSLLDAPRVRRLVALSRRKGSERTEWETAGLQAIDRLPLPESFAAAGYDLFEAVAPQFQASVQAAARSAATPRLLLADHRLQVAADGGLFGRTRLDVFPAGARHVTLVLPPGWGLVHAQVAGIPAHLARLGSGRWRVATASQHLPQRMELVYSGRVARAESAGRAFQIPLPALENLPAEQTLWTALGSDGVQWDQAQANSLWSREDAEVRVLDSIADVLAEIASTSAASASASAVGDAWLIGAALFQAQRQRVAALGPSAADRFSPRIRAAEEKAASARERAIASAFLPPGSSASAPAKQAAEWIVSKENHSPAAGASNESPRSVQLRTTRSREEQGDGWLLWAVALVAGAVLTPRLLAARAVHSWLLGKGHFLLAWCGVGWLLIAPFPWLGWIAIVAALWLAIRPPWRQQYPEPISGQWRRP
ncbi:MAG: hypothetical protein WD872_21570, partial [Pirellulaceae bacterium]